MDITWYGLSCFRITERGFANIVTDPYQPSVGLTLPRLRADVVTRSHDAPGHNNFSAVSHYKHEITGPGEYEIGGVFITGVATRKATNNVFLFDFDTIKVAHLGDIAKVPSQTQIEAFGEVNILLLPVGGGASLNGGQAAELVSMLEPQLVIPMHYATEGLSLDLEGVDRFLKEIGATEIEEEQSLRVSSSSLSSEETQIVLLKPKV